MFRSLFFLLLFLLIGCATPTPYQPADSRGYGYVELKLEERKRRISFKGNRFTGRQQVEIYLFYRAAETALAEGYTHFRMGQFDMDRQREYEPVAPMVAWVPMQDFRRFPYYVYGNQWTPRGGTMVSDKFEAVAYVILLKKPSQPPSDAEYNAAEVVKNLKDKVGQ